MIPEDLYKRRHFGTPISVLLVMVNFFAVIIAVQAFAMCQQIKWYFWLTLGVLAVYNIYQIWKNPEVFDRKNLIVYSISLILLLAVFFLLRLKAQPC